MQEHRSNKGNKSYGEAHVVRSGKSPGDKMGYHAKVVDQRIEGSLALLAKPELKQEYQGIYGNEEVRDIWLAEAGLIIAKRDHGNY